MATAIDYSTRTTVVGVFDNQTFAQDAIRELKSRGFSDTEIGIVARDANGNVSDLKNTAGESGTRSEEMAQAGVVTGAGVGAVWALGIAAGMLPAIGPAIAGGILGSLLSSAVAVGAAAGIGGALIGLGVPEDEAKYYHDEVKAGRALVTVKTSGRSQEAHDILARNGAYDMHTRDSYQSTDLYRTKLASDPTRKPR